MPLAVDEDDLIADLEWAVGPGDGGHPPVTLLVDSGEAEGLKGLRPAVEAGAAKGHHHQGQSHGNDQQQLAGDRRICHQRRGSCQPTSYW